MPDPLKARNIHNTSFTAKGESGVACRWDERHDTTALFLLSYSVPIPLSAQSSFDPNEHRNIIATANVVHREGERRRRAGYFREREMPDGILLFSRNFLNSRNIGERNSGRGNEGAPSITFSGRVIASPTDRPRRLDARAPQLGRDSSTTIVQQRGGRGTL